MANTQHFHSIVSLRLLGGFSSSIVARKQRFAVVLTLKSQAISVDQSACMALGFLGAVLNLLFQLINMHKWPHQSCKIDHTTFKEIRDLSICLFSIAALNSTRLNPQFLFHDQCFFFLFH